MIFKKNKAYKLITKNSNDKIKVYTATILEEDDFFLKFLDRENNEITINKDLILEVK
jgi:hypothetical protein